MRCFNEFSLIFTSSLGHCNEQTEIISSKQAFPDWTMQKAPYYIHWLLLFAVGPTSDEAYSENSNWFSPLEFHFNFRPFLIAFPSQSKLDSFASVCAMISRNGVLQTKYRANKRQQNSLSLFLSDYFSLRLTRSNRKFQLFFFPP